MTDKKHKSKKVSKLHKKVISGLKSREVIELLESLENIKLTYDRLYYYESTDLIVPSIRKASGKGVDRLYSVEDVVMLRWLLVLNKNGISVQSFRNMIKYLKRDFPEILKQPQNWEIKIYGKSVRFKDKINSRIVDVLKDSGQYLFFT